MLLTVLFWPVTGLVRRRYGAKLALPPRGDAGVSPEQVRARSRSWRRMGLWAWTVSSMLKDNTKLTAAFDGMLGFVQLFGTVAFLGGFAAMAWNLWAVWTGKRRWPARTWSVVLLLSAAGRVLDRRASASSSAST